jgi:hypothetical protein
LAAGWRAGRGLRTWAERQNIGPRTWAEKKKTALASFFYTEKKNAELGISDFGMYCLALGCLLVPSRIAVSVSGVWCLVCYVLLWEGGLPRGARSWGRNWAPRALR